VLRSTDLASWLGAKLLALAPPETAAVAAGPLSGLVEMPSRVVTVTRQGGPQPDDEGHLYVIPFRVEVRGAQRIYDDAETLADEVDDALLLSAMPDTMGAWRVVAIRALQRPAYLGIDTGERFTLLATYEVLVSR
jgi:hypothetical protein